MTKTVWFVAFMPGAYHEIAVLRSRVCRDSRGTGATPLESAERVKVPRSTVRRALLLAVPVAFSNRALRACRRDD